MRNRKLKPSPEEEERRVPFVDPYFSLLTRYAQNCGFRVEIDEWDNLSFQRGTVNVYLPEYKQKAALIYTPDNPFSTFEIIYDRLLIFAGSTSFCVTSDYIDVSFNMDD